MPISPQVSPFRVFNRINNNHKYRDALERWYEHGPLRERASVCNLLFDHRVSQDREMRFDSHCIDGSPVSPQKLHDAFNDYYADHIKNQKNPDFLDPSNHNNRLNHVTTSENQTISNEEYLVNVLNLTGLGFLYNNYPEKFEEWTKGKKFENGIEGDPHTRLEFKNLLDNVLKDERNHKPFIEDLFSILTEHNRKSPRQPTWCSLWQTFTNEVKDYPTNPLRWLEVVGKLPPKQDRWWLILLRYNAGKVPTLYTPTILDTNLYEFHFPNPPDGGTLFYSGYPGICLDLKSPPNHLNSTLLPEFLHQQIDYNISYWEAAGSLCKEVQMSSNAPDYDLVKLRNNHRDLLHTRYPYPVNDYWMNPTI